MLVAPRGGVVATMNNWVLRYEGTLSDGRLRFLENVLSGEAKDVVFDPKRSPAYPFGDFAIRIVRYDPARVTYRIERTD